MQVKDKVVVVTGGADGIGAALCRRFAADGARHVAVVDRNGAGAAAVATGAALTFTTSISEATRFFRIAQAASVAELPARGF